MEYKLKVTICMGSSCFIRGNRELADKLQRYIVENNLSVEVQLKGHLCFSECGNGPLVYINDEKLEVESDKMFDYIVERIKREIK